MFWGFCEPLDIFDEYHKHVGKPIQELHILLYGSGDPRHIIKTLAESYRHNVKLRFYMVEGCLEILARNMLLLSICLEPAEELSLKGKTHMFMDIYGNSLLRPTSYTYLCSKANHFIETITDYDYANRTMPIFDLSNLKFSERDGLENIFEFWRHKKEHIFKIDEYWERRVRSDLGNRYDTRDGAFDWDLQMKLKSYGAKQLCSQEYKHWRDTGVAFVFPEYEHTFPNKTLAAGLLRNGDRYQHRGYVGDIYVGPFATFGLNCPDQKMLQSNYGTNSYRSTDVSERNLYELMYEIQEMKSYEPETTKPTAQHQYGATMLQLSKHLKSFSSTIKESDLKKFNKPIMAMENLTISVMNIDTVLKIQSRKEFKKYFDVIFVAQNYFPFLKDDFLSIAANESLIFFETKQLSVLRKEDISAALTKIREYAKCSNLDAVTKFNLNLPCSVARYTLGVEK